MSEKDTTMAELNERLVRIGKDLDEFLARVDSFTDKVTVEDATQKYWFVSTVMENFHRTTISIDAKRAELLKHCEKLQEKNKK
jgi:hypothetical protein